MDTPTTRDTAAGLGIAAIAITWIAMIAACLTHLAERHPRHGIEFHETLAWFAVDVVATVALAVAASVTDMLWDRLRAARAE